MRTPPLLLLAPLLALTLAGPRDLRADDPARPGADALAARLAELRSKRAALEKEEAAVIAELRAELKRIADLVDKLGLNLPLPKPPEPPGPAPVDPLVQRVRDAIKASAGDDAAKRKQCLDLAALYRAAAKLAPDAAQFPDADALLKRLREAAGQMLGDPDALREVRKVVAGELAAVLPTVADAPLTDAHRAGAVKVFERLATILEEAGK